MVGFHLMRTGLICVLAISAFIACKADEPNKKPAPAGTQIPDTEFKCEPKNEKFKAACTAIKDQVGCDKPQIDQDVCTKVTDSLKAQTPPAAPAPGGGTGGGGGDTTGANKPALSDQCKITTLADPLGFRVGPNITSADVFKDKRIPKGTTVTRVAPEVSKWTKVSWNGKEGYVCSSCLNYVTLTCPKSASKSFALDAPDISDEMKKELEEKYILEHGEFP